MITRTILPLLLTAALPAFAGESKPLLAIPGKVIYENSLGELPTGWATAKGKWDSADGALRGAEKPEDNHGAVARYRTPLKDFIVQYEVKLDGAKTTTLSINDAKDHMARILIAPTMVTVQRDDNDHDGPDKSVVFARLKADIKPGEWHTVRMELVGDTMLGQVDEITAYGSDELFTKEKANFGFTVSGQSAQFRNLKVWEATANPDWEKAKKSIPEGEKAAAPKGRPGAKKAAK